MNGKKKFMAVIVAMALVFAGGITAWTLASHKAHVVQYNMDRIEGNYAVIEVYDETLNTISYVNVKIQK